GLALGGEIAAGPAAEIELVFGVGVKVREAAHGAGAEGDIQRIIKEIEQFRVWRAERRAAARYGCALPGFEMVARGFDAFLQRLFRQRVEGYECIEADIVEDGFQNVVEERQPLLDALAADAGADAVIKRIADR